MSLSDFNKFNSYLLMFQQMREYTHRRIIDATDSCIDVFQWID